MPRPPRLSHLILLSLLALVTAQFMACKKGKEAPPAKQVRVSATKAYEKYFGAAPTTDKGTCFAFVIYFPSAKERDRVVPFPFFTFDEKSMKKVAIERLLGGMEIGSYKGEFAQPVPPGTHILDLAEKNGVVTVNFSKEIVAPIADETVWHAAFNAVALTLRQFSDVKDIRIQVEGKESGKLNGQDLAKFLGQMQPVVANESAVREPSPPRILSVTAMKDKGATNIEEVNVFFDRPVEIQNLSMTETSGKPFIGDTFHSVFEMAAVMKPKDPSIFKEQMPIKVRWKVTDKVGRHAEGDSVWPLEVKEH